MPHEFTTSAFYGEVVPWLQENVGKLLWSRPIVEWKGEGWTMNSLGIEDRSNVVYKAQYLVRVDNPELAAVAALRWSG